MLLWYNHCYFLWVTNYGERFWGFCRLATFIFCNMVLYVVLVLAIEAFLLFRLLTSFHLICSSFFEFQSMSKVVHPTLIPIYIYICKVIFVLQYDNDQNQNLPWYQWSFHLLDGITLDISILMPLQIPFTIFVLLILANF